MNVEVLKWADVVVSSLTKIFSGDSNVMGGSLVLNPASHHFSKLSSLLNQSYIDTVWFEDAIFLERNSRNYRNRILRINETAEQLVALLSKHPKIKHVYYPKITDSSVYSKYRKASSNTDDDGLDGGGYGGLFSIILHSEQDTIKFFDNLAIAKGPSLGTNFTLACCYTLLAHYGELEWAKSFSVDKTLVRVSIGLEHSHSLMDIFTQALDLLK